jgi:hypothetical protein
MDTVLNRASMRQVRMDSFAKIFGMPQKCAEKMDKLANRQEYVKERKLNLKIEDRSKKINNQ